MAKKKTNNKPTSEHGIYVRACGMKVGYKRIQAYLVILLPPGVDLPKPGNWRPIGKDALAVLLQDHE